jgi:hypothetical protein
MKKGWMKTYGTFAEFAKLVAHREHGGLDQDLNSFLRIAYPRKSRIL